MLRRSYLVLLLLALLLVPVLGPQANAQPSKPIADRTPPDISKSACRDVFMDLKDIAYTEQVRAYLTEQGWGARVDSPAMDVDFSQIVDPANTLVQINNWPARNWHEHPNLAQDLLSFARAGGTVQIQHLYWAVDYNNVLLAQLNAPVRQYVSGDSGLTSADHVQEWGASPQFIYTQSKLWEGKAGAFASSHYFVPNGEWRQVRGLAHSAEGWYTIAEWTEGNGRIRVVGDVTSMREVPFYYNYEWSKKEAIFGDAAFYQLMVEFGCQDFEGDQIGGNGVAPTATPTSMPTVTPTSTPTATPTRTPTATPSPTMTPPAGTSIPIPTVSPTPIENCAPAMGLVIDASSSILPGAFKEQKQGLDQLMRMVKGNYAMWQIASTASSVFSYPTDQASAINKLTALDQLGGGTDTAGAIIGMTTELKKATEKSRVMVISTDGAPNSVPDAVAAATVAKQAGIIIILIGVGDINQDVLEQLASPGLVYRFTDFAAMMGAIAQVGNAACEVSKGQTTIYIPMVQRHFVPVPPPPPPTPRPSPTSTPAPACNQLPYRVTGAIASVPVIEKGEVFFETTICLELKPGQQVHVAGSADGTKETIVDDVLSLSANGAHGDWDYSLSGQRPYPLAPYAVAFLREGQQQVVIRLSDKYDRFESSSELWFTP